MTSNNCEPTLHWEYDAENNVDWKTSPACKNRTYIDWHMSGMSKSEKAKRNINPRSLEKPQPGRSRPVPNYRRLDLVNQGVWDGGFKDQDAARRELNYHVRHALGTQLGLTDTQLIELHKYGFNSKTSIQGVSKTLIDFCLCAIVCDLDGAKTHPSYPSRNRTFEKIRKHEGISKKMYDRWFNKLRYLLNIPHERRREPPSKPTDSQFWSLKETET